MRFTLKQLQVLKTVSERQSTTAAASAVSLSQSAVSSALQQLEAQIGSQLFDRVGRQLRLNRVGYSALPNVLALLEQAHNLEQQLLGSPVSGTIEIGASFTIANHVIVDAMVDFQELYSDIDIRITSDNSPGITDKVIRGDIDFGLVESKVTDTSICCEPWLRDELVIFSSPTHRLTNQSLVSRDDLAAATWVLREPGSGARSMFNKTFDEDLNTIDIAMEFRHNEPIKRAVARGVGIGCLSSRVLERELADQTLNALEVEPSARMPRRFFMIKRHNSRIPPAAEAFWEQCLAIT
jgi:DNA-binding transcriptional LysR family regulator